MEDCAAAVSVERTRCFRPVDDGEAKPSASSISTCIERVTRGFAKCPVRSTSPGDGVSVLCPGQAEHNGPVPAHLAQLRSPGTIIGDSPASLS